MKTSTSSAPSSTVPAAPSRAGMVVTLVVAAIYCVVVHLLIVDHTMPSLMLLVISAPWLVLLASSSHTGTRAWSQSRTTTSVIVGFKFAAGAFCVWELGKWLGGSVDLPIFAESFVFLISLAGLFAASLFGKREALVTRLARMARQDDMTPAVVVYTRRVTMAWALFFVLVAGTSTVLFTTQSREAWSAFVNLALWPLTGLAFAIEYVIRLRVLPDIEHVSPMAGVRAFMQRDDDDAQTPREAAR